MPYRLRDLGWLVRTPLGRHAFAHGLLYITWPVLRPIAAAYRRTLPGALRVIAVVGSLGKTTTQRAIAAVIDQGPKRKFASNGMGGLAVAILSVDRRRPAAVLEVGITRPGQMAEYARLVRPDIVVVTSIGDEHHRSLRNLDTTRQEKSAMVRALPPRGLAILNADDPNVIWIRTQTNARVVTFGFGPECDVRAEDWHLDWPNGLRFTLHAAGQRRDVAVKLIGRHFVYPVLAAVATSLELGIPLDTALERLARLVPIRSRLEPLRLPNDAFILLDDYKSDVDNYDAALQTLATIRAPRKIAVLGDVTEPKGSITKVYRKIALRAGAAADFVVLVGAHRHLYKPGLRQANVAADRIIDAGQSVQTAAAALKELMEAGDVALIKGRNIQRLRRIALMLQGTAVGCAVVSCHIRGLSCEACPSLGADPKFPKRR